MTVDIGDGRQDVIHIHEDDHPAQLAHEFALRHNLESSVEQSLSLLIQ